MIPAGAVLLVGSAGVAYVITQKGDMTKVPAPAGAPASTTVKGGGVLLARPVKATAFNQFLGSGGKPDPGAPKRALSIALAVPVFASQVAERISNDIVAEVEKKARAEFKKLSSDAKAAGARVLNEELGLNPPLNGTEDFDKLMKVLGSAAGAAAGNALCGPLCGKIGAVIGAYLGGKIAEWLSDQWGSIKAKAEEYYNKAKNFLGGLVEDVGDAIEDGLSALNPF